MNYYSIMDDATSREAEVFIEGKQVTLKKYEFNPRRKLVDTEELIGIDYKYAQTLAEEWVNQGKTEINYPDW